MLSKQEYRFLRNEIDECLKNQEQLFLLAFSITSVSILYFENIMYIFLILLLSLVVHGRILHARNTVYYISSFIRNVKVGNDDSYINWECRIFEFKAIVPKFKYKYIKFAYHMCKYIKNFSILFLDIILSIKAFVIIYMQYSCIALEYLLYATILLLLILNVFLNFVIAKDKMVSKEYDRIWKKLLIDEQINSYKERC